MKNVLLLGDSIRMGYDKTVRKTLEGKANVYFPDENCRFASNLLRYTGDYGALIENGTPDIIHWNAGLWDCLRQYGEEPHTPIDVYAYYIRRICLRMLKLFPNAKIIFATSTSVISEKMGEGFKRYNSEIEEYNKIASEIVKEFGFEIDDLYAVSAALPESAHSDAVHYYTAVGTEAFTNKVLSHIVPYLDIEGEIIYKEDLYTDEPVGM
ncbi:MAG: hypothetical protein E7564_11655 [Ruminococcaceae bacterium]|nr:hypothetical protein [Oscillospiraceae bacterium]